MDFLNLKSTRIEKKNSLEGLSSTFELAEERISKFEDRYIHAYKNTEKEK